MLQYRSKLVGYMNLNLKRLFARSMTGGLDLAEPPVAPSARSAKRKMMFITLAGILAVVGTLAGAYYFAMRPVTLRVAVGPANSDDLKVVQALTQAFTQARGYVRLRPIQTDGAAASAQALADGKADLAIIRGDLPRCLREPQRWCQNIPWVLSRPTGWPRTTKACAGASGSS